MYNQMFYSAIYCPYYFRAPFTCTYCGLQFNTREELRQHIFNSHIDKIYELIDQPLLEPLTNDCRPEQIFVDNDYLNALNTADKYLYAWMTRNGSRAYELISDNVKKKYKDREDFIMQFAGVSNPHHEAFEIVGCKRISKQRIRFKVWLYYHYTGEYIPPYKRPDSDVYIELLKVNKGIWLVDNVI